jgi:hypothetical protein
MALYLTKSRFKLALECPTKLYYSNSPNNYFDSNRNNEFLQSLADGGNQMGELAKFKYHSDPIGSNITVETLDYEEALSQTNNLLKKSSRVVIAEAALLYEMYFVRVDILIKDEISKTIDIIEVKSKSIDESDVENLFKGPSGKYKSGWLPYLYDVTFQAEVAKHCFPNYQIRPKLLLLDANAVCDVDGLYQNFKVLTKKDSKTGRSRVFIQTPIDLTRDQLGNLEILREVDVSSVVDDLRHRPIDNFPHVPEENGKDLQSFMQWAGNLQKEGIFYFGGVSKTCKSCQYRAPESEQKKSGVHECWKHAINQAQLIGSKDISDRTIPLSIDLWGGGSGATSITQKVLDQKRAFVSDIEAEDIKPKNNNPTVGLSAFDRRMAQIKSASISKEFIEINEERLSAMDQWEWPLHMIDFETSAPAIPFFKGLHPYETLAFQFSHHVMEKKSEGKISIRHANQWISTKAETFPSIDFVRALRAALMPDGQLRGTVCRYHSHENTVLRKLRSVIINHKNPPNDSNLLIDFIDLITKSPDGEGSSSIQSKRMVDIHRLVQEGFYSGRAGSSISLKSMLPSILGNAHETAYLYRRNKIYGAGLTIPSLNFSDPQGHIWLQSDKGDDPYKTLPPIFGPHFGEIGELISQLVCHDTGDVDDTSITHGGLAMTAFNYTQFTCLGEVERLMIESALLRYCELDTLAMVILVQGLMELRGRTFALI